MKEKRLQVWSSTRIDGESIERKREVLNESDAISWINERAAIEVDDDSIECNSFGLEEFDGEEWTEYYNEDGEDICEIMGNQIVAGK